MLILDPLQLHCTETIREQSGTVDSDRHTLACSFASLLSMKQTVNYNLDPNSVNGSGRHINFKSRTYILYTSGKKFHKNN